MLCEVGSIVALSPQICQVVGSQGHRVSLFVKVRLQPSYIYVFVYLYQLELNCTICKDLCYSIRSLFNIIQFAVVASHFRINLIANCVVMHDLPSVFSNIINFYLVLLFCSYNLPVYDWREVEYHVSSKYSLSWCDLDCEVIRGPYLPCDKQTVE